MAKGSKCPACGEQKFTSHEEGGRKCSECGCIGWLNEDNRAGGGGKGKTCGSCGETKLHLINSVTGHEIRHCTGCSAVAIAPTSSFCAGGKASATKQR